MLSEEIRAKLLAIRDKRRLCKIRRSFEESGTWLHGFVVGVGSECIMLHALYEFHLDGFSVLPIADIEHVESGKAERVFKRILKAEGVLQSVHWNFQIDLECIRSALASARKHNDVLIVEAEQLKDDAFYIGKIVRLTNKNVFMRTFDVFGTWDDDIETIDLGSITRIGIEQEYATVFARNIPRPP